MVENRRQKIEELKKKYGVVKLPWITVPESVAHWLRSLRLWEKYGKEPNEYLDGPINRK